MLPRIGQFRGMRINPPERKPSCRDLFGRGLVHHLTKSCVVKDRLVIRPIVRCVHPRVRDRLSQTESRQASIALCLVEGGSRLRLGYLSGYRALDRLP